MSLISVNLTLDGQGKVSDTVAPYFPSDHVKERLLLVRECLVVGDMNMTTPRREFNDLSLVERMSVDRMSWNTYQPNDGDSYLGDPMNSWKSNAIKPIVRNKAISMAAHATAAIIFPKVFAENENSDEDKDSARVMRDLVKWVAHQSKYPRMFVHTTINAIVDPASVIFSEFCEVYKKNQTTGEDMLDPDYSGFQNTAIPVNELYIENFYENNIQKQGFLILRKVISYSAAKAKYEKNYEDFKYVKPGMQTVYSDANNTFYYVYDPNLTGDLVEELTFWHKGHDLKLCEVNGVLLSDPDEPNPRLDKQYPFAKTGFEYIDGGRCFYYKSLVFKMGPDARIVNELYPMIVDGTYLSIFPPMFARGGEEIGSDVIVPGAVTTLSGPDADLRAINTSNNLVAGMNTMMDVIGSINQTSQDPLMSGDTTPGTKTAYEVAKLQQNAMTDLSLFMKMIGNVVEDFGDLLISDICQHLTVGEVVQISGKKDTMKYKSFLIPEQKDATGRNKSTKIMFDSSLPDEPISEADMMAMSLEILKMEGGPDSKKEINRVNPKLFRNLKYRIVVSPDIMNPLSEEIEHAFKLEAYDRMISNPTLDQNEVTKDFLLNAYDISRDNSDKYFAKVNPMMQGAGGYAPGQQGANPAAADIMNKVAQAAGGGAPIPPRSNAGGRKL